MSPRTKLLYLDNDLMPHLASIPLHSILYIQTRFWVGE